MEDLGSKHRSRGCLCQLWESGCGAAAAGPATLSGSGLGLPPREGTYRCLPALDAVRACTQRIFASWESISVLAACFGFCALTLGFQ